jgi:long-chain acyl-CoA synthetase
MHFTDDPNFTLADIVRRWAIQRPDAPAITFDGSTTSFAKLHERSSRLANGLLDAGLQTGDRVAVLSKNSPVFYELAFACAKSGTVSAGLNWRLAPAEIAAVVADAAPRVIFVAEEQRALLAGADLDRIRVISLDDGFEAWLAAQPTADPSMAPPADDVVLLLYTSGTTGVPKGAQLTNRSMAFSEKLARDAWAFTEASVNLVSMPMFHIGGIGYGMSAVVTGGHTVLLRDNDPATLIETIARYRVTNSFFVPAVIQTIVSSPDVEAADLSSLKLLCYGASPIGDAVLRRALAVLGCQFTQAYGMTETTGTVVALPPSDHRPDDPDAAALLRSCGKPLPWVEIALFDPATGERVAPGAVGEIWVRSPMNMAGYRNKPAATAETITAEGWLRTGDAAYADDAGYLYLFDRFKDMIVSGAENIYPAEIENVLYDHPAVAEVAVIGVPHERWGETPKAMVVLRAAATATSEELIEFTRTRLARYKCPSSIEFVEMLPRNASGKVLKKDLRAPYWRTHERGIA